MTTRKPDDFSQPVMECPRCGDVQPRDEEATGANGDASYHQWLLDLAKECRCCPDCWQVPCDGCQQGGACDRLDCRCDDDYGDWDDEDLGDDDEEVTQ